MWSQRFLDETRGSLAAGPDDTSTKAIQLCESRGLGEMSTLFSYVQLPDVAGNGF